MVGTCQFYLLSYVSFTLCKKNIHGIVEISDTFNKKVLFQCKKARSDVSTNLLSSTDHRGILLLIKPNKLWFE